MYGAPYCETVFWKIMRIAAGLGGSWGGLGDHGQPNREMCKQKTPGHEGTLGQERRQAKKTAGSWGLGGSWGVLGRPKRPLIQVKARSFFLLQMNRGLGGVLGESWGGSWGPRGQPNRENAQAKNTRSRGNFRTGKKTSKKDSNSRQKGATRPTKPRK